MDNNDAEETAESNLSLDDKMELNRQNEARMEEIERDIKQQPLTSDRVPIFELDQQYKDEAGSDSNFRAGVAVLKQHYRYIRMVRGDGNCYYRAFLYSLVERILEQQQNPQHSSLAKVEGERIVSWLKKESWDFVLANGYDEMTIEMFHDAIVELLERVTSGQTKLEDFHLEMNAENGTSDYCTWYMRVITAAHLKSDPGRFLPFIEQPGLDVQQFCRREVEPMGKECEMLQALALAEAFGVKVQIEYLDGHELVNGRIAQHTVGAENAAIHLTLLYRPGHYDILYPISG
ncbi:hypothetical protein ACA910_003848 [Epithemia clementina (nom. ined.)]